MIVNENEKSCSPIFIMGLSRSGSTLLSRLLNTTNDIISVNDLYYLQCAIAINAVQGTLDLDKTTILLYKIIEILKTRSNSKSDFIRQFEISEENLITIRELVLKRHEQTPYKWYNLLNETLTLAAESVGKVRWADKTPQNFYHYNMLAESYPDAKFIFLLRNPIQILSSYKFAKGEGHNHRRYNPIVYSYYWRTAIRYYLKLRDSNNVIMIKYEELVGDTKGACELLNSFLDTNIELLDISSIGNNSSFNSLKRKTISQTESWICYKICSKEMKCLGYDSIIPEPKLHDLPYIITNLVSFTLFQFGRYITNRDARKRIYTFIHGLFSTSAQQTPSKKNG